MDENPILIDRRTGYRILTLNRPQRLNAFTIPMHQALAAAIADAEQDQTCRALLLTGTGRAFSSGQDLNERVLPTGEVVVPGEALGKYYNPLVLKLRALPFPVVCAVNGIAAGAGLNIALACDVVLAARSATFTQVFARLGLVPDAGGTWLLPRLVGRARALGLAMLGDKLSAEQAERIGLIWKCVDDAAFADEVQTTASRLAELPTRALVATRAAIDAAQDLGFAEALSHEGDLQRRFGASHDYLEGVAAFMAKRPPRFTDR